MFFVQIEIIFGGHIEVLLLEHNYRRACVLSFLDGYEICLFDFLHSASLWRIYMRVSRRQRGGKRDWKPETKIEERIKSEVVIVSFLFLLSVLLLFRIQKKQNVARQRTLAGAIPQN